MQLSEIMSQPVSSVREDASLEEVAQLMLNRGIGCVPVVDAQGRLRGIITESDFMAEERYVPFSVVRSPQVFNQWVPKEGIERIYADARRLKAGEIMSSPPITVEQDATVSQLMDLMLRHEIHHVPVVKEGVPVGIVTRHDLLRMLVRHGLPSG